MICVYWITKDYELISRIKKELNIPKGITINGENEIHPTDNDLLKLRLYEQQGIIQLRYKSI